MSGLSGFSAVRGGFIAGARGWKETKVLESPLLDASNPTCMSKLAVQFHNMPACSSIRGETLRNMLQIKPFQVFPTSLPELVLGNGQRGFDECVTHP